MGSILKAGVALVACLFSAAGIVAQVPDGWQVKGQCEPKDGWLVAQEKVTVTAPLASGTVTWLGLRLGGVKQAATCRFEVKEGKAMDFSLAALYDEYRVGLSGKEIHPMPDACVDIKLSLPGEVLFNDKYFVRPHPHWYEGDERKRVLAEWTKLPSATTRELALKIEARGKHVGLWIDDRFVGGKELPFTGLRFTLSPGNAIRAAVAPLADQPPYVPLGLRGYRRPGALKTAEMPLARGMSTKVNGVPFEVAAEGDEIDVGKSPWLAASKGPEQYTDNYYTRSAFDSRPEDILLAVPTDDYAYAHLLCVVDPIPRRRPPSRCG